MYEIPPPHKSLTLSFTRFYHIFINFAINLSSKNLKNLQFFISILLSKIHPQKNSHIIHIFRLHFCINFICVKEKR